MDRINVFIYRDKADGRINGIDIIAEKEIVRNCDALKRNIENGITEMLLEDIQKHNADSRSKSIVEWTDCRTLLDAENLLHQIRSCLRFSKQKRYKSQYHELQCGIILSLAVFPKPPLLFKPCKASFHHPPFGNYFKCM